METEKKACCARAAGWALIGSVIAVSWGIGNLTNGMSPLQAFAIPGLVVFLIMGVMVLAALDVPWFNRLCNCPAEKDTDRGKNRKAVKGMPHGTPV